MVVIQTGGEEKGASEQVVKTRWRTGRKVLENTVKMKSFQVRKISYFWLGFGQNKSVTLGNGWFVCLLDEDNMSWQKAPWTVGGEVLARAVQRLWNH